MPVKKIEGGASFEEVEAEVKKETLQKPHKKHNRLLPIILSLSIIALGLLVFDLLTLQKVGGSNAFGSVSGTIVNSQNTPVAAEVFVLKSEINTVADLDGNFILRDVPDGAQRIIVAWQGVGKEIPVIVKSSETSYLGLIEVEETKIPPE